MKQGMIKVTVMYPNKDGEKFDLDYYLEMHVPLVSEILGDALKAASYDKGLAGGTPGTPAPFVAVANLYFDSIEEFSQAFAAGTPLLMADLTNFTNTEPVVQISVVMQ